jgi:hypothetical protein
MLEDIEKTQKEGQHGCDSTVLIPKPGPEQEEGHTVVATQKRLPAVLSPCSGKRLSPRNTEHWNHELETNPRTDKSHHVVDRRRKLPLGELVGHHKGRTDNL